MRFLRSIYQGYRQDVAYHNDLHGLDVAQMMYVMLKSGGLKEIAKINYLDMVSTITAAACHDFAHDGFTNAYHVNFVTDRALRYHDKAVQENWHASESLKILLMPENNFTEEAFDEGELKVLRKRMISMILATDMAEHMSALNGIDYKVKHLGITHEANNGHLIVESENENELFENQ